MAFPSMIAAILATFVAVQARAAPPPVASIAQGRVSGISQNGVEAYLGIPYAAPPTGENRWRAPQPVPAWQGTRAADAYGPSCPQAIVPDGFGPWTQEYVPSGPTSEDCLSLNVWRPAGAVRNLPVLVWIHGGGFTSGSASVPVYDGAALARQGIVVVSINYRLGFLGSLAGEEFRGKGGGNFGLQDQIAALRWIQRNIGAFGGDPRRVTIAGQSAGAMSVHYLMLSPQARGLFRQAIPQSGLGLGLGPDLALPPRAVAERSAAAFLAAAQAETVEEARHLSLDQLNAAFRKLGGRPGSVEGLRIGPYADGAVLPLDPATAFAAGRYNDTPILVGLTADEGSGLNRDYRTTGPDPYRELLRRRFGPLASEFAAAYPYAADGRSFPRLLRDSGIFAITQWSRARARTSRFPMYAYLWTHVEPGPDSAKYGAFHTSEVPYVFRTLDKAPDRGFTANDQRLSQMISAYWLNFVRTGNPNGRALTNWPNYRSPGDILELGDHVGKFPALDPRKVELFRQHAANGGANLIF